MKTPNSLYSRLALITSVTLVVGYFVVYAVYENISAPEIAPSATITSTLMGKIKTNLDDLDTRVTNLTATVVASSIWSKVGNDINYTAGKVGIGTATPNKSLHIQTPTGTNAELNIQSGIKPLWGIYHDETTEELRFWNGANRVVIGNTGNVGIGGTPTAPLQILTSVTDSDLGKPVNAYFGGNKRIMIGYNTVDDVGIISSVDRGVTWKNLVLQPIGGNVGIGTTTPAQKLSVAGTVESTSGGFKFPDGTTQATSASSGSVPTGAVMAFNLAACPTGWTALASAAGRVIVGKNTADTSFNVLGEVGGEKTHTLTVAEMPNHSHGVPSHNAGGGVLNINNNNGSSTSTNNGYGENTNTAGSSTAFNVLQPYLTLLYCQKN